MKLNNITSDVEMQVTIMSIVEDMRQVCIESNIRYDNVQQLFVELVTGAEITDSKLLIDLVRERLILIGENFAADGFNEIYHDDFRHLLKVVQAVENASAK